MLAARQFLCVPEQFRILMRFIVALADSVTDAAADDMYVCVIIITPHALVPIYVFRTLPYAP